MLNIGKNYCARVTTSTIVVAFAINHVPLTTLHGPRTIYLHLFNNNNNRKKKNMQTRILHSFLVVSVWVRLPSTITQYFFSILSLLSYFLPFFFICIFPSKTIFQWGTLSLFYEPIARVFIYIIEYGPSIAIIPVFFSIRSSLLVIIIGIVTLTATPAMYSDVIHSTKTIAIFKSTHPQTTTLPFAWPAASHSVAENIFNSFASTPINIAEIVKKYISAHYAN